MRQNVTVFECVTDMVCVARGLASSNELRHACHAHTSRNPEPQTPNPKPQTPNPSNEPVGGVESEGNRRLLLGVFALGGRLKNNFLSL